MRTRYGFHVNPHDPEFFWRDSWNWCALSIGVDCPETEYEKEETGRDGWKWGPRRRRPSVRSPFVLPIASQKGSTERTDSTSMATTSRGDIHTSHNHPTCLSVPSREREIGPSQSGACQDTGRPPAPGRARRRHRRHGRDRDRPITTPPTTVTTCARPDRDDRDDRRFDFVVVMIGVVGWLEEAGIALPSYLKLLRNMCVEWNGIEGRNPPSDSSSCATAASNGTECDARAISFAPSACRARRPRRSPSFVSRSTALVGLVVSRRDAVACAAAADDGSRSSERPPCLLPSPVSRPRSAAVRGGRVLPRAGSVLRVCARARTRARVWLRALVPVRLRALVPVWRRASRVGARRAFRVFRLFKRVKSLKKILVRL